jgi:rSAM/selenodomain-associated transferase 2/rSAM/selenodomain-associated transferase 1
MAAPMTRPTGCAPETDDNRADRLRIAIVMPVLNEALRLHSALGQFTADCDDLVIVDGGSTDRTVVAALAAGRRVAISPRGRARQMNEGARLSGPVDVLLFVHADVLLPSDWRAAIERAVRGGASWGRFDVGLNASHPVLSLVGALMNLRSRLSGIATGDQAIFITREAWLRVDGWPDVALMEDVRMSQRLLKAIGRPACLAERVLVSARRWEQQGILRTIVLMWWLRALHALGVSPDVLHRLYYGVAPGSASVPSPSRVIVFAKVPRAGEVKTRLAAKVGESVALATHRQLLERTLEQVARVPNVVRELCIAGDDSAGECAQLARRFGFDLTLQRGVDLGERMANAMALGLSRGERVVLLGSDSPVIDAADIAEAVVVLATEDDTSVVFSPTEDGGYLLVGVAGELPPIFEAMKWSHPDVMLQTVGRLDAARRRYRLLRTLWDVDDAAGWARWQTS